MHTIIIAEAGVNHNGSLDMAYRLCDAALAAGVDIVKFQTWKTEKILTSTAGMADYQKKNTGLDQSQYAMVEALELGYDQFEKIKRYCSTIGIEFLSTPDEEESLDFLIDTLGIQKIKVGSGEVTNIPYLRRIAQKHLPVILSTGMSNLAEVARAYDELMAHGASQVSLLHCTTNYPCPMDEVNLNAMKTLKDAFKTVVGYSDHTLGVEIPIAAVAMGAEIIEKHFTLDKNLPGPDHAASLNPAELKHMVVGIRNIELAMGDGIKRPNKSELEIKSVVRRSVVAAKEIKCGETFNEENICVKRAGPGGITAEYWDIIVGKIAKRNYNIDELIELI